MNQYEAIYNLDCVQCDRSPVVGLRDLEGEPNLRCTQLCGVCFFGDRMMADPDLWNEQREGME